MTGWILVGLILLGCLWYLFFVARPHYTRMRKLQRDYIREVHPHMTDKEIDEMRKILF